MSLTVVVVLPEALGPQIQMRRRGSWPWRRGRIFLDGFVQGGLVIGEGGGDDLPDAAALHGFIQGGHGVHAALAVDFEGFPHAVNREAVADELGGGEGAFAQPVAAPAIAFVGVGGVLKAVAAQGMEDLVLNDLDGGRKIGDVMVRIGIEADNGGVGEKAGEQLLGGMAGEEGVVDAGEKSRWKPPTDSAARWMACRMRAGSNLASARLRFWTLTMRFCTAIERTITAVGRNVECLM